MLGQQLDSAPILIDEAARFIGRLGVERITRLI
jgi:hypothetical protein